MPVRTSISFQLEPKCLTQPCSSLTVNSIKDACSASERAESLLTAKTRPSGRNKRATGKRKVQDAAALSRYSDLEPFCGAAPTIKTPVVLLLEQQKREKQDAQRRAGAIAVSTSESVEPPALHELGESDSESDEPLAKKHAKRVRPVTGSRKKHNEGNENAAPPPTKSRSKAKKALGPGSGPADKATNHVEKTMGRRRKVAPDADPPPPTTARGGANSGSGSKVQVLREKNAPTNVPRKRKERVKALLDPSAKDENEHEPPRKKSRRADPPARRYVVLFPPPPSSLGLVSFLWCSIVHVVQPWWEREQGNKQVGARGVHCRHGQGAILLFSSKSGRPGHAGAENSFPFFFFL